MRVLFSQKANFKTVQVGAVKPGDTFETNSGIYIKLTGHDDRAAVNIGTGEVAWFELTSSVFLIHGHFTHEGRRNPVLP